MLTAARGRWRGSAEHHIGQRPSTPPRCCATGFPGASRRRTASAWSEAPEWCRRYHRAGHRHRWYGPRTAIGGTPGRASARCRRNRTRPRESRLLQSSCPISLAHMGLCLPSEHDQIYGSGKLDCCIAGWHRVRMLQNQTKS